MTFEGIPHGCCCILRTELNTSDYTRVSCRSSPGGVSPHHGWTGGCSSAGQRKGRSVHERVLGSRERGGGKARSRQMARPLSEPSVLRVCTMGKRGHNKFRPLLLRRQVPLLHVACVEKCVSVLESPPKKPAPPPSSPTDQERYIHTALISPDPIHGGGNWEFVCACVLSADERPTFFNAQAGTHWASHDPLV